MTPKLVPCPNCEGDSIEPAEVGGIKEGGCSTCSGTGLVDAEEVEKGRSNT
jgi:DnaJ-class molecular chaperone